MDFLVGERMDGCSLCSGRTTGGDRSSRDKLNNSLTLSFLVGESTDDCSGRRQILSKLKDSLTLSFLVGERTDDCSGRKMGGGSSSTSWAIVYLKLLGWREDG